jgi:hypothetical protein
MLPMHGGEGEPHMTRQQYGMIAVAGAAMAAAWFLRWRSSSDWVAERMSDSGHDRGELIYSNAPVVSES